MVVAGRGRGRNGINMVFIYETLHEVEIFN